MRPTMALLHMPDSPKMRDSNPTVVLMPGVGMFSFGKNKTEARITGEFYTNAIHVMEGATALDSEAKPAVLPQAGPAAKTDAFSVHANYVALPPSEAFRIEYWQLEEAKIRQTASGKGTEPAHLPGSWRRERRGTRDRAARSASRSARGGGGQRL